MGEVLKLTSEKKGYTLTDEATYLSMKTSLQLDSLVAGDKKLSNPYSVIVVTGAKNLAGAKAFQSWILGPLGQAVIKNYGVDKFGKALFIPDAK
jgi:tungstate transport system substrate-binding protein